jgi:preprotein translocase subunit SecD
MNRNLLWRGLLIFAVTVVAFLLCYPLKKKINLGLDLQGGMHLVLQVNTGDALRVEVENNADRLVRAAADEKIKITARRISDTAFEVLGATEGNRDQVDSIAQRFLGSTAFTRASVPGRMIYQMTTQFANQTRTYAVRQAVETIRNRVDQFGVTEPVIQEASGYRIVVELPGIDDAERVRRLIKSTALLEFRLVRYPSGGGGAPTREAVLANYGGNLPADLEIMEGDVRDRVNHTQVIGKQWYAVEKRRVITGNDLKTARVGQGSLGEPVVNFSLKPAGAEAFGNATGSNIGTGLAIILDGRVVSAPRINARITNDGLIEGGFSQKEAEDLSTVLRSGALPASLTYLEERTIGPWLGRDSIRDGLLAGIVGTGLVVLTMLLYYRLAGVNAVTALALNVLILFGGLGAFHSTLTLPGIAGIILTIGMAVDANVLVFERIREELRAGRTVRSAIDQGFGRAFSSIIDTHVTTLISAMMLFQFGTGPIKGFAVTLTIGLLASLFTAVFVSRWIFDVVLSRRRVQQLSI